MNPTDAQTERVRSELLAHGETDRRVRAELAATGELFNGYHPRMEAVHGDNADFLERVIVEFGWPVPSRFGREAAYAAWMILQHAIGRPALQRRCLPILWELANSGQIESKAAAMLEDRISFFEGRPQRYGTQFDWDVSGLMSPWKLLDPIRVDEWRADVGLEPLQLRIESIRADLNGAAPPADLSRRKAEMEAWTRRVGWRPA